MRHNRLSLDLRFANDGNSERNVQKWVKQRAPGSIRGGYRLVIPAPRFLVNTCKHPSRLYVRATPTINWTAQALYVYRMQRRPYEPIHDPQSPATNANASLKTALPYDRRVHQSRVIILCESLRLFQTPS